MYYTRASDYAIAITRDAISQTDFAVAVIRFGAKLMIPKSDQSGDNQHESSCQPKAVTQHRFQFTYYSPAIKKQHPTVLAPRQIKSE